MANLRVLSLLAAAALLLAPAVAAQSPAAPTASLTTYTVSPESATIPLGGQMTFNVTVVVTFDKMICPAEAKTVMNIATGSRGLAGVEGTIGTLLELTVAANVPAPPATSPAGTTTTATGMGQFVVTVSPTAAPNHDHVFQLNATYSAGIPTGCHASTAPGDEMQPTNPIQTRTVSIKTGPGAGNQTTSGPSGTTTPGNNNTTQASPLADVPFVALMVLGVALVASRRRFA